jgi:hypothetical protein
MIFSILELILEVAKRDCEAVGAMVLRLLADEQVLAWSLQLRDVSSLSARDMDNEWPIII